MPKGFQKCRFTERQMLRSPLKLIGGKTSTRDYLYSLMPPHTIYVEPFLGSGAVWIGKPKVDVEIVVDINRYVINFFQQVRFHPDALIKEIQHVALNCLSPCWERDEQKAGFKLLTQRVTRSQEPVRQAAEFYLITKHCMNGIWRVNKQGECNSSFCGTVKGRGIITRDWLDAVVERIANTKLYTESYTRTLERADSLVKLFTDRQVFAFLDPPYHDCKTTYNGIKFINGDFKEMANILRSAKYKWMLTINDDAFIRDLFKDYSIIPHEVHYSCSQTVAGRGKKPELIITNY